MRYVVGIDPGLSGAIAFLDITKATLFCADMPLKRFGYRSEIDREALGRLFDREDIMHAGLEAAFIIPGTARQRAADEAKGRSRGGSIGQGLKIGQNWGLLDGVLAAHFIPTTVVRALEWKRAINCPTEKSKAIEYATTLMPACKSWWPRQKDDGRAEAAMIAWYIAEEIGIELDDVQPVQELVRHDD